MLVLDSISYHDKNPLLTPVIHAVLLCQALFYPYHMSKESFDDKVRRPRLHYVPAFNAIESMHH